MDPSYYQEELTQLLCTLQSLIEKEGDYPLKLEYLQYVPQNKGDVVTPQMRNASVRNLRVLNRFYGYPTEAFMLAVNIMDRFLSVVKARPHHMACVTISCYHMAIKSTIAIKDVASATDLIRISQSRCTTSDLYRMQRIILEKLHWDLDAPTPMTFLHIFHTLAYAHGYLPLEEEEVDQHLEKLLWKLEACMCQSAFSIYKASTLALSLLSCELAVLVETRRHSLDWRRATLALQLLTEITDCELFQCRKLVSDFLEIYSSPKGKVPRMKLTWIISSRTAKQLQFSAQCVTALPTIHEHQVYSEASSEEDPCNSSIDDPPPYQHVDDSDDPQDDTMEGQDKDDVIQESDTKAMDTDQDNSICVDKALIYQSKQKDSILCHFQNIYSYVPDMKVTTL
ncbi:cyclin-G1-like [Glandiceps talaboti]